MDNKKRIIVTIVITVLIGILTIAGSFALWTTIIGNNINVAFNTIDMNNYIDYTEGKAIFAGNLETTNTYTGATFTTLTIQKINNPAYPFYASLNLRINTISSSLSNSRVLKWTVTKKQNGTNNAETVVAESDFVGTANGDTIMLVPNIEVTTTKMDYNVYIWVDSTNANASSVVGETIDAEIWMDVYQYRAPVVLEAYCYIASGNMSCNVLDSEKQYSQYGYSTSSEEEPASYTSVVSSEYWTPLNDTLASYNTNHSYYVYFKSTDGRIKKYKIK